MKCIKCNQEKQSRYIIVDTCLDCLKLKAVDTIKKYRSKFNSKAIKVAEEQRHRLTGKLSLTGYWLKIKAFIYGSGEKLLDRVIDKATNKISWILIILIGIFIIGLLLKKKK